MVVVAAVVGLWLLVLVHEGGHYVAARRLGIATTRLTLGVGPVLWSSTPQAGHTTLIVRALPLIAQLSFARNGEQAREGWRASIRTADGRRGVRPAAVLLQVDRRRPSGGVPNAGTSEHGRTSLDQTGPS